jgi:hypothetical protein
MLILEQVLALLASDTLILNFALSSFFINFACSLLIFAP